MNIIAERMPERLCQLHHIVHHPVADQDQGQKDPQQLRHKGQRLLLTSRPMAMDTRSTGSAVSRITYMPCLSISVTASVVMNLLLPGPVLFPDRPWMKAPASERAG